MMASSSDIADAARRFCDDFARNASIDVLLTHFSPTPHCEVIEHGVPMPEAPFLGHPYKGLNGARRYFATLAHLISYGEVHFSDYIVDPHARKVSVKGTATFFWIATRQSWRENFVYLLDFDGQDKITRYQIWGDTRALYLASQGFAARGT